jgi:hypothetical protein
MGLSTLGKHLPHRCGICHLCNRLDGVLFQGGRMKLTYSRKDHHCLVLLLGHPLPRARPGSFFKKRSILERYPFLLLLDFPRTTPGPASCLSFARRKILTPFRGEPIHAGFCAKNQSPLIAGAARREDFNDSGLKPLADIGKAVPRPLVGAAEMHDPFVGEEAPHNEDTM